MKRLITLTVLALAACTAYMPPAPTMTNYTGRTDAGEAFFPLSSPYGGGESGGIQ